MSCKRRHKGGGAEEHGFAEVVSALLAVPTRVAHDAALYSDAFADTEVGDAGADGGDDTCGLMAEDEGRLDAEVAVAAMGKVVGAAETSRAYGDSGFAAAGGQRVRRSVRRSCAS